MQGVRIVAKRHARTRSNFVDVDVLQEHKCYLGFMDNQFKTKLPSKCEKEACQVQPDENYNMCRNSPLFAKYKTNLVQVYDIFAFRVDLHQHFILSHQLHKGGAAPNPNHR